MSAAPAPDDALDAMQVAERCGWTVSTLYKRMKRDAAPPSYKVNQARRWNRAELERWIATRKQAVR